MGEEEVGGAVEPDGGLAGAGPPWTTSGGTGSRAMRRY